MFKTVESINTFYYISLTSCFLHSSSAGFLIENSCEVTPYRILKELFAGCSPVLAPLESFSTILLVAGSDTVRHRLGANGADGRTYSDRCCAKMLLLPPRIISSINSLWNFCTRKSASGAIPILLMVWTNP